MFEKKKKIKLNGWQFQMKEEIGRCQWAEWNPGFWEP